MDDLLSTSEKTKISEDSSNTQEIVIIAESDNALNGGNTTENVEGSTSIVEYTNNDKNITPCYICHVPEFYHDTMRNNVKDDELKANFLSRTD